MASVLELLKGIGLEDLNGLFEEEDIQLEELVKMKKEDLENIGVKKFGHRQRIMNAVEGHLQSLKDASSNKASENEFSEHVGRQLDTNGSIQPDKEENIGVDSDNDSFKSASDYEEISLLSLKRASENRVAQSAILHPTEENSAGNFSRTNKIYQTMRRSGTGAASGPIASLLKKVRTFRNNARKRLRGTYEDIQNLLRNDMTETIKKEITDEFGDVEILISERIPDLDDESCPIVITGETSAGKSSFVNLLLGVDLMPQSSLSCTSTICRIYNRVEKSVTLVCDNNQIDKLLITPDISPKDMRTLLKRYVSVRGKIQQEDPYDLIQDDYAFIDISWPIPYLDENILIVDTPGVGPDDPELTARLFQYLPKALAFIYVLNTPNAGGVQSDRILQIQSELTKHSHKENVPLFDSQRAIFICNKWDQIHEDPDEVFLAVQQTLEEYWIGFRYERLFKLSTREEMKRVSEGLPVSEDFEAILFAIEEMLPSTIKEKYYRHLRYQEKIITKVLNNLSARIRSTQRTKEENEKRSEEVRKRIQAVKESLPTKKNEVIRKSKQYASGIAANLYKHIKDEETYKVMFAWCDEQLPDDSTMQRVKEKVDNLVMDRLNKEVKIHLQNTQIKQLETFMKDLFNAECFVILEECQKMEEIILGEETDIEYIKREQDKSAETNLFENLHLGVGGKAFLAITSPVLIPATIAFGVVVGILLLPFGAGTMITDKVKDRLKLSAYRNDKVKFANKRANRQLNNITPDQLQTSIDTALLKNIESYIDELFEKIIPHRIAAGETLLMNIHHDMRAPREIRQECHSLERKVFPIFGSINAAYIDLFDENTIKREDVEWTEFDGNENCANLKMENELVKASSRKMFSRIDGLAHFTALAEIQILRKYHHQNVVKLYGICSVADKIRTGYYLFKEYCETNLAKMIFEEHIRYGVLKDHLKDCLEGLCYLHQNGVVHKDIRLENFLVKDGIGKLSEGRLGDQHMEGETETVSYPIIKAPEVYEGFEPGCEADIFQFGFVIWETLHRKRAFHSETNSLINISKDLPQAIIRGIRPAIGSILPNIGVRVLLENCWHNMPDKRPTAKDIKNKL